MARTVDEAKLESRAARMRLEPRGRPYFRAVGPGLHLGYRRNAGRAGRWLIRTGASAAEYIVESFAVADDIAPADGIEALDYRQALARARELGKVPAPAAPSFTIGKALDLYLGWLTSEGRSEDAIDDARWRIDGLIKPPLGVIEVASLTAALA